MSNALKAWMKDTAERVLWTFVQGATAVLTADQFDLLELGDGGLWKAALAGGIGAIFSLLKSSAAVKTGATAQLGAKTYSYTEPGPGSAGAHLADDGEANLNTVVTVLVIILLVVVIVRLL